MSRIGAARRRFGDKAVDAVLARESLVLAQVGGAGTIASSPAPPRPTSSGVPNKDELDAFVDQPLLDRLRLRVLTSLRYEFHTDAAQDAGSIYLSMQLRWLAL